MAYRIAHFTSWIGSMNIRSVDRSRVQMCSGGIIVMFLLSLSPWSTPGGRDKVSVGILVFPRMY